MTYKIYIYMRKNGDWRAVRERKHACLCALKPVCLKEFVGENVGHLLFTLLVPGLPSG